MRKFLIFLFIPILLIFISTYGFYDYWNNTDPVNTCANCHEITPSVFTWQHSAHRDIKCYDCHGTALSNGMHSLKEKANMVFTHIREEKHNDEIGMNEDQVLEVNKRCTDCHQSEYVKWASGGHAVSYRDIFLDSIHNSEERLYWDCFRCHGMFYEGNIYDLVKPVSKIGPWEFVDKSKEIKHSIPCLACHQIHTENETYQNSSDIVNRNPAFGLYIRSDRMFLRADHLPLVKMYLGESMVKSSTDPAQSLCVQCHAPGAFHGVNTSDDRTPIGVHEGIGCIACHDPHSNNADNSCIACHPAITNCGLDVTKMNTSFYKSDSPNNIHFVACSDCHDDR